MTPETLALAKRLDDSAVFNLNTLEPHFQKQFNPSFPWIFEADGPNGEYIQECFENEEEACQRQREWRK